MYAVLMTVHIVNCMLIILVVLLQAGRGAGFNVFGGGGDTLFASPSGSSFMTKLTAWLAGVFALTSLMLTLLQGKVGFHSVTNSAMPMPAPAPVAAPATPGQPEAPAKAEAPAKPAAPAAAKPAKAAKK
ncbi:MAG: preprotein translocase subunit SecG [Elusimicrobia bacterium]|nr:preprotein translocase subunit SecG [Elusimicrobiota bacterium]